MKAQATPRVAELATLAGAALVGSGDLRIDRVSSVEEAGPGSLTFAVDARWVDRALRSSASAVIVPSESRDAARGDKTLLVADDVRAALAAVLGAFAPELPSGDFTHPSAVIAGDVRRGADVWIGPGVIVGSGASIGDRCVLLGGAYVGAGAVIGKRTLFHPRATVLDGCEVGEDCVLQAGCVIGGDGFGFVRVGEEQIKIPQIGNVVLGDRVEVGANAAIDRAVTGSTRVGSGTKIDNLVQIGHNCQIGENCVLCGQMGVAGSTRIGRAVTAAGQVGIAGHIEIGDHSLMLAKSGVIASLPPNSRVFGYPAQPHRAALQQQVLLRNLPKLEKQLRALMDAVAELRKRQ
ncbi:MAG TPA: UDP-3-O-(3-hydroxymyristoyl)glucosamine N-acyltransferase [Candidatus Eremiobacteraceae bacterium]|nr:UDP-3-O-(3-hydroxymyristoyl)glucosamine N-acyltransferase [Candidatus Eremiobacteraceae bacterium]